MRDRQNPTIQPDPVHYPAVLGLTVAAAAILGILMLTPTAAQAQNACLDTSDEALVACGYEVLDDYHTARAICFNESDAGDEADCLDEADEELTEAQDECDAVWDARNELCDAVGPAAYDPDFDPADFLADEDDFQNNNEYYPLRVKNSWTYVGGGEVIITEVLDATKLIEGVTCVVFNDQVYDDGELIENTDDWLAQAIDGAVHYCGEIARDYETFEGDDPEEPELVEIEGSFKAGRDGAKSGILFPADPQVGDVYRQEWALGDAEDAVEVISIDYSYGDVADLDELVPQELAELLCNNDCVVTRDFTPLEPGAEERKYYARGIGPFLEVNLEDDEIVQLVACNVNNRVCNKLPDPAAGD